MRRSNMRRKMSLVALSMVLTLPLLSWAQRKPGGAKGVGSNIPGAGPQAPASWNKTLQDIQLDLREAKGLAAAIRETKARKSMDNVLARIERHLEQLRRELPPVQPTIQPLLPADFDKLVASVKKESFDDNRLSVLKLGIANSLFTCEQAKILVKCFSFSQGQKDATYLLYPLVVDPRNFSTVIEALTFPGDRQEVRDKLNKR